MVSRGNNDGLALLWNKEVDVTIRYHIDCDIFDDGICWHFSGVYGCPKFQKKKHTCELLWRLNNNDDSPWLVGVI